MTMQLKLAGNRAIRFDRPFIMGVINVSPDSFSARNRCQTVDEAVETAERLIQEGADILDVGGEATNPQIQSSVAIEPELARVVPVIQALRAHFPQSLLSVDTSQPEVIRAVADVGADLINDQRALRVKGSLAAIEETGLPVCLMHMSHPWGRDSEEQGSFVPADAVSIKNFLKARIQKCHEAGIDVEKILIDPGIGGGSFGKTPQQDLALLANLDFFTDMAVPLLVGVSRKSFLGHYLLISEPERVTASVVAALWALQHGAQIVRVHDVKQTLEACRIWDACQQQRVGIEHGNRLSKSI